MCLLSLAAAIGWRISSLHVGVIRKGTEASREILLSASPVQAASAPSEMAARRDIARTAESESSAMASAHSITLDAASAVATGGAQQRASGAKSQGTLAPVSVNTVGARNVKRLTNAARASDLAAGHSPRKAMSGAEQSGARKADESRSFVGKSDNAAGI
jgi:hypothetical protein